MAVNLEDLISGGGSLSVEFNRQANNFILVGAASCIAREVTRRCLLV